MCNRMKSLQLVLCLRLGAGAIPCRRRILATLWSENLVTQIDHCPDDAIITPAGVLTRQFHYQLFDCRIDLRAGGQSAFLRAVEFLSDDDTRPGSYPVWRCRRFPVGLSVPDVWQSRPRSPSRHQTTAIVP